MRIYKEETIKTYGAWAGAIDMVERLTDEEANLLEAVLEGCYPEGLDETTLNDILWFEDTWILEEVLEKTEEEIEEFWSR